MDIDPTAVKAGFDAFRSAIDTFKRLRDQFKGDPEAQEKLSKNIEQVEKEVQLAEAQIAQALGYKLCLAHNPPVTMLLDRVHPKYIDEIFKCPECERESPSPEYFEDRERSSESLFTHRSGSWMS